MQQVLYGALWVGAASQKVLMDCLSHNTIPNLEAGLFHRAAMSHHWMSIMRNLLSVAKSFCLVNYDPNYIFDCCPFLIRVLMRVD